MSTLENKVILFTAKEILHSIVVWFLWMFFNLFVLDKSTSTVYIAKTCLKWTLFHPYESVSKQGSKKAVICRSKTICHLYSFSLILTPQNCICSGHETKHTVVMKEWNTLVRSSRLSKLCCTNLPQKILDMVLLLFNNQYQQNFPALIHSDPQSPSEKNI